MRGVDHDDWIYPVDIANPYLRKFTYVLDSEVHKAVLSLIQMEETVLGLNRTCVLILAVPAREAPPQSICPD